MIERTVRWLAGLALLIAIFAPRALASGPELSVELSHSPTVIARSDERLVYDVKVHNDASSQPQVGDELVCNGTPPLKHWFGRPVNRLTFAYQWVRNGMPIPGATSSTYTVVPEDAGRTIQCVVGGTVEATNPAENETALVETEPATAIGPSPLPPPSLATQVTERASLTLVGGSRTVGSEARCAAPEGWTGSPTWSFKFLRNGTTVASGSSYVISAADLGTEIQCEATAVTGSGDAPGGSTTITYSNREDLPPHPDGIEASPGNEAIPSQVPTVEVNSTSGPVALDLELPGGLETTVVSVRSKESRWECAPTRATAGTPASLACTVQNLLSGGASFPDLEVGVGLGADAPEPASASVTVSGGGVDPVSDGDLLAWGAALPFGLRPGVFETKILDAGGAPYTQAGGHPTSARETFAFNSHTDVNGAVVPVGHIRNANTQTPRGFVGSAQATPILCKTIVEVEQNTCPPQSMVGGIDLYTGPQKALGTDPYPSTPSVPRVPIYQIVPEYGVPAQFAFSIGGAKATYTFIPELRADDGYALSLNPGPIVTTPRLIGATPTLCSFGAKRTGSGPDSLGSGTLLGARFSGCKTATEEGANPVPLVTNPTGCAGGVPVTRLVVDSWETPSAQSSEEYANPPITGCGRVHFEPSITIAGENHRADSPTGLEAEITMPSAGLESSSGVSQANLDTATVTLPPGMAINPATASGLGACSPAQVKLKSNAPAECPGSSRVGEVEVDTPLLSEALKGDVYVATQNNNPFNSTLGLYLVFSSARYGVTIKVAGKVVPDPTTGQLTSVFTESPEAPFSRLRLKFSEGPRAPLMNPPQCGNYSFHADLSPWSAANPESPTPAEVVSSEPSLVVNSGPNGGACPTGALEPKLSAGMQNVQAGSSSPFVLDLSREDGSQRFSAIDVAAPKGLTASLKGIPYCPDATIAGISTAEESGRAELTDPSCPGASQVGTVQAGAGAGPNPFYAPGKVYLAGPYKGAPLSLVVVTPAVAGPFDLGNVVIRNALYVDPTTAQVTTVSDPIPTIQHGILLDVRDVRISLDRPDFTRAPTSCEPMAVDATVKGDAGGTSQVTNRFQVGGCDNLKFSPKLQVRLTGGTRRNSTPALTAILTQAPNQANIGFVSVALPHSEFLEQGHIRTVCTRVQFAAEQCPTAAIYGHAEATTPLLDQPLQGPVYLRSSSHRLPDLVAVLKGPPSQPIEIDLDGRVDSYHQGIRTTFESVPDAPVSRFVLKMQGGKKGLLVNSTNICRGRHEATVRMTAQNASAHNFLTKVQPQCGKKRKKSRRSH